MILRFSWLIINRTGITAKPTNWNITKRHLKFNNWIEVKWGRQNKKTATKMPRTTVTLITFSLKIGLSSVFWVAALRRCQSFEYHLCWSLNRKLSNSSWIAKIKDKTNTETTRGAMAAPNSTSLVMYPCFRYWNVCSCLTLFKTRKSSDVTTSGTMMHAIRIHKRMDSSSRSLTMELECSFTFLLLEYFSNSRYLLAYDRWGHTLWSG